ncbi:TonB-linked outer membrane protein, SusC/RagA family [Chitinophaga costaii]|uniref:TonB-linked outer membrane protein, SusC/RagA family n=1 Tax=Chitinophaga costaii TaxID=1335309 RepID=A0A1C4CU13_9BACT|nr:TonB-dependent receptor [Chitinophaga costaii]SCC22560.1 TonB-linked outer membrane protein, SusC/RagA family [Chitinophaga costaii]
MKKWFCMLCLAGGVVGANAQIHKATGRVADQSGQGLPGVSVKVLGTNLGTSTDAKGNFSISAGAGAQLVFSYVGFTNDTLPASEQVTMDVKMKIRIASLNDLVVVGYGTQKKANLTGAVAQVSGEVLSNRSIPNITQGLQGAIPNLNLVMGDGKPIQSPSYNIRGNTSIGQGGSALVLIDGVQGDPSLINPNDVASVTVLKDASSAAIYGARAAFGVVLITTKNPTKDKTSVTYSSNYSLKSPTSVPDIVSNGYEYATQFNNAWSAWNDYSQSPQNINKTQPISAAYLAEYKNRNDNPNLPKTVVGTDGNYVYYGNTDWYKLLYKNHSFSTDQNLSVSGSSAKASYYITGRYYGQEGLFRYNSDNYKMYNFRAKGSVQVLPWLQVNNSTDFASRSYHNPLNVGESGGIWRNMADEAHPSAVLFNPDGSLTFSAAYTVGDFVYGKNGIDTTNQQIRNTTGFEAKFNHDHFRVKGDFTFQIFNNGETQRRVPVPYSTAPGVTAYVGTAYNDLQNLSARTQYTATNIYGEYENHFGGHYIKALAGYNYEQSVFSSFSAMRNGLAFSGADNLNLALGQNINTIGAYDKWAILGGFGRLNYAYKDRYLVEFNGRYDGSSKFPANQRYAFFPSVSAGWRLSQEPFWHLSPKIISDVKIRGSFGSLGNGNIASYAYQEVFNIAQSSRVIGGVLPQKTAQPNVVPDGLTWETARTVDAGLDLALLSDRLTFSGDIYERKTTNMFTVGPTLPDVFGTSTPKGNYADMKTLGWEANLTWTDHFQVANKPFHYSAGVWMSDYHATILRYNNATGTLSDYYAGEHLGEIWGLVNDGFMTAKDADYANSAQTQTQYKSSTTGHWLEGDLKFKDLNGDNKINNGANTKSNPGDQRIIGNSTPRYTYGIKLDASWNNFSIGAFFQGVGKQDWFPGGEADAFWGQYNRPYNYALKYQQGKIWTADNPNAYFPRYRGYVAQGGGELAIAQNKYLQNVRYIRLKNLQVGYNLPLYMVSRVHLQSARFFLSGENLWTASPLYKLTRNIDVENIGKSDVLLTGGSNTGNGNNYPILKSFTFGLQVSL